MIELLTGFVVEVDVEFMAAASLQLLNLLPANCCRSS
jgi:hypothetical protein